jgi:hypothetical protein
VAVFSVENKEAPPARLEHAQKTAGKTALSESGVSKSDSSGAIDPDLQSIINVWQQLSTTAKAAVMTVKEESQGQD